MKKYMFFDIDGTLTCGAIGMKPLISQTTKDTLRSLEEQGHFLAIATGRPYFMCKEIAEEVGIDHIVCNGGNDVYIKQECIEKAPLDYDISLSIIHQCIEKDIAFCASIEDGLHRISLNDGFAKLIEGKHFFGDLEVNENIDFDQAKAFHRLFVDKSRVHEVDFHGVLVASSYREVYVIVEPDDKYHGIEKMMHHLEAPLQDVVVFGDGNNDIRMFQRAPLSIAMGNGVDELKKIASFVTHNSDEDGIHFACQHFDWL